MPVVSSETFCSLLERSHLLAEEALAAAREELTHGGAKSSPEKLAQALVKQRKLTRWQAQMLLAGRSAFFLGKYKLLELIGQGGMGAVFRAEQVPLGRIVALKVMSKDLLKDGGAVLRFQREIQAAAALNHPNIVTAYDADCVEETHFLVMEYVAGEGLDEVIKRRKTLPIGEACEYIRQTALGLQHAHERGMVHRDIKPSNLLISTPSHSKGGPGSGNTHQDASIAEDSSAVVKILDFGLARLAAETKQEGELTQTGQIMGTPDYIAPEQARNTRSADIRSDIFSLGCTLFRLLTGTIPFPGENVMAKLMARALGDAPRVRKSRPEVPVELDAVVAMMLAREPAQRYQAPSEVVQALAPFVGFGAGPRGTAAIDVPSDSQIPPLAADLAVDLGLNQFLQDLANEAADDSEGETSTQRVGRISDPAVTQSVRAPSEAPRGAVTGRKLQAEVRRRAVSERRQMLKLGVALVVLVLVGVVGTLWYRAGATLLTVDWPAVERVGATLEIDGTAAQVPETGDVPAFPGRPGKRTVSITRPGYEPIAKSIDFARGETISFRPEWEPTAATQRNLDIAELRGKVEGISRAAQSNDPAVVQARNGLLAFLRRTAGSPDAIAAAELLARLPSPADKHRRENLPKSLLTTVGHGDEGHAPPELVAVFGDPRFKPWGYAYSVAFHPEGRIVACSSINEPVQFFDVGTGLESRYFPGAMHIAAFSSDGKILAARHLTNANEIALWDFDSGRELRSFSPLEGSLVCLAFSPDDKLLAAGADGGSVKIWDVETGEERLTFKAHETRVNAVCFSPDVRRLATGCIVLAVDDKVESQVKLWDLPAGTLLKSIPHDNNIHNIRFFPDGRKLAFSSVHVHIVDAVTGEEVRQLKGEREWVNALDLAPGGSQLAGACWDGTVPVWNPETGEKLHTLEGFGGPVSNVAFHAKSRTLAVVSGNAPVRLFNMEDWAERYPPTGARAAINDVAVSPDGTTFAAAGSDGRLILSDLGTGKELRSWSGLGDLQCIAFDSEGARLAAGSADTYVRLFDLKSNRPPQEFVGHWGIVYEVCFTPDGKSLVASGIGARTIVWNITDGIIRRILIPAEGSDGAVEALATGPEGNRLATGDTTPAQNATVLMWDAKSGAALPKLKVPGTQDGLAGTVRSIAFDSAGKALAAAYWGNSDTSIRVWDLAKRAVRLETFGDTHEKTRLTWTLDGRLLAWVGSNGDVHLWNLEKPRDEHRLIPLTVLGTEVAGLTFTRDGRHLLTANGNGTVYLLRVAERR